MLARPDLLVERLADTGLLASALPGRCHVRTGTPPRIEMELPGRPGLIAEVETTQWPTKVVHSLAAPCLPSPLVVTFDTETRVADEADKQQPRAGGHPVAVAVSWPRPRDVALRAQRQWELQVARQVEHLLSQEPLPDDGATPSAVSPRDHDDRDRAPGLATQRRLAKPGMMGLVGGAIVAVGVILLRRRWRRATTEGASRPT